MPSETASDANMVPAPVRQFIAVREVLRADIRQGAALLTAQAVVVCMFAVGQMRYAAISAACVGLWHLIKMLISALRLRAMSSQAIVADEWQAHEVIAREDPAFASELTTPKAFE